jgi:hypothetical protein
MKTKYRVTDASIYTIRPVVSEQRFRMIEEIKPPEKEELGPLGRFISWVIGVPLGLWLAHGLVSWWCGCQ